MTTDSLPPSLRRCSSEERTEETARLSAELDRANAALCEVRALVDRAERTGWWPGWRIEAFRGALGDVPDEAPKPGSGRPHVRCDPAQRFGQPNVKGVPCEAIGGRLVAGEDVTVVAEDYTLTRSDVLITCWYLGIHGSRRWRRLWGAWARDVAGPVLWHADPSRYGEIPDPPTEEKPDAV